MGLCNPGKVHRVEGAKNFKKIFLPLIYHLLVAGLGLLILKMYHTVSFSKDVFSQEAVNWVFLGLFH